MKDLQHRSIPRENDYLRLCGVCSYGVIHCDTYKNTNKIQIKTCSFWFVYSCTDAKLMLLICWVPQHVILRVLPSNLIIYPKAGTLLDPATSIFLLQLQDYPKVPAVGMC